MAQSLSKVTLHPVFSTKNRTPFLQDRAIQEELHGFTAIVLQKIFCNAIQIDGVEDYLHVLTNISRTVSTAKVVEEIKAATSRWLKSKGGLFDDFYWQSGYAAFSVSESNIGVVSRYISRQQEHHKKFSFKDELRALCKKHGITIDENYVWS